MNLFKDCCYPPFSATSYESELVRRGEKGSIMCLGMGVELEKVCALFTSEKNNK